MKTSSSMVFLGTTTLTFAIVLVSSLQGCRANDGGGTGNSGTTTSTHTGSGGSGTGDGGPVSVVTIRQITDPTAPGHVGALTPVKVENVVAMSTKFLVSKSSSGNCLWGVFISAPGITTTAANTGILAVSYGTPATATDGGKAFCPVIQATPTQPAGDSFPDDVAPGDVLDVTGQTDSYIPSTCASPDAGPGASNVAGFQISKVNSVIRTGKVTPPKPAVLSMTDVATLAAGSDTTWLNQWGNVRVEIDGVTVMPYLGALTDTYGHMFLEDGLQVGDKLYYVGYVKSTDACYSGPSFATYGPSFTSITGFVYLDYCNWSIAPADKCHDLVPPSIDCAAAADAGPDASPGAVCLH